MDIRTTRSQSIIAIVITTALILAGIKIIEPEPTLAATATANTTTVRSTIASASQQEKFTATLSGNEEVPPTITQASGSAKFTLNAAGNSITFRINAMNIDKVTMVHIHSGKTGKNGPIVATLFQSTPNTTTASTGAINGMLSQGTITSANLEGPLKGKQISDLVKLINDNKAYVNVHTEQYPKGKGEIRGQISSASQSSAS
jgi:hypothetical protein